MKDSVFLSYPKPYLEKQKQFIEKVVSYLENRGLQPRTLGVTDYDMDAPLTAIRRLLLESNGLIAIAFRRSLIVKGTGKPDSDIGENAYDLTNQWLTSPYCQIEPAMAFQLGLPVLIIREKGVVEEGILEKGVLGVYMPEFDLDSDIDAYFASKEWTQIIQKWEGYKVAIFFSGLERSLKNSKYNLRQDECKAAAYALMGYAGMDYDTFANTRLRDVPFEVFEAYKDRLPELWRRRAEHYYSEFARAEKGAELWRKGDLEGYGQLVFESGKSSIYSYECGCDELKKLYEIMADTDGIYGGRFSGAGFKGCCMALIDPDKAEDIEAKVTAEYLKAFPALEGKYSFHLCESADGVEL